MHTISFQERELHWHFQSISAKPLPPHLKNWLLDAGSLTAKLVKLSDGDFHVKVLQQVVGRANRNEAIALGIPFRQYCLIREVVLMGCNQPWVFARSVLPLTSLTGHLRQLRKQGSRPLGAFLFNQPQLTRSPIALAQISRHHAYVPAALLDEGTVWGRRSIFYVNQKPLLVSEVFLPQFPSACAAS